MSEEPTAIRLLRKLENFTALAEDEKTALSSAMQVRTCGSHEDLICEGDQTGHVNVVLSGLACRQKMLPDGRRQIVGFLLPGDMCDVWAFTLRRMDHTISTISSARMGIIPREVALGITEKFPRLMRAMWWASMVEESIAREWIINVGQRTALERLAHLFCEIYARLSAVGLTSGNRCELPLTQAELADTLALSTVHVNRMLRELRHAGLISMNGKSLVIHDFKALQSIAMFDANYLHLDGLKIEMRAGTQPGRDRPASPHP
jgi:CRP-like cAMP-binding protein